jgi:membrane associated rhomboid family serine protease
MFDREHHACQLKNLLPDSQSKINSAGRPSMCRSCGAIVGAGEGTCAVCGEPLTSAQASASSRRVTNDRDTMRFARAVLSRPYIFTVTFLVINFFIFLLMWQSSEMKWAALMRFPDAVLVAYGAKLNFLISQQHQWWRFITPMFVHVDLPHVLINMYSLWVVGPYVEKLYGSAKFVFFWVVAGIAGVVASYLTVLSPNTQIGPLARFIFKTTDGPSAGASGALFGLIGVLFVFGIKYRHELPEGFKRAFGTGLLPVIMVNLLIGFFLRGLIDNAAHLGGLLAGAVLALVIDYRRPGERKSVAISWHILQFGALALVAFSFFEVTKHFHASMPVAAGSQAQLVPENKKYADYKLYLKALTAGQEAFQELGGDPTRIDNAIVTLDSAPSLDAPADELRDRLKRLLVRGKELPKAPPAEAKMRLEQQTKLKADVESWKKDYERWLGTSGKQYAALAH